MNFKSVTVDQLTIYASSDTRDGASFLTFASKAREIDFIYIKWIIEKLLLRF